AGNGRRPDIRPREIDGALALRGPRTGVEPGEAAGVLLQGVVEEEAPLGVVEMIVAANGRRRDDRFAVELDAAAGEPGPTVTEANQGIRRRSQGPGEAGGMLPGAARRVPGVEKAPRAVIDSVEPAVEVEHVEPAAIIGAR